MAKKLRSLKKSIYLIVREEINPPQFLGEQIMRKYRVDQYDSVYELSGNCYIFVGKLNGLTLDEFVEELIMQECE